MTIFFIHLNKKALQMRYLQGLLIFNAVVYPLMALTPGNSLPSIYSSKAPPPVET